MNRSPCRLLLAVLVLAGLAAPAAAAPKLASSSPIMPCFSAAGRSPSGARADPGERLTVTLGEASRTVTAGRDGAWRVELPAHAGGRTLCR